MFSILKKTAAAVAILAAGTTVHAQTYDITSPDGQIKVGITAVGQLSYKVERGGKTVLADSDISMSFSDGSAIGKEAKASKTVKRSVSENIASPFYRSRDINVAYNEIDIRFGNKTGVVFRAYDEGVAYRFYSQNKKPAEVTEEVAEFGFDGDHTAYVPYSKNSKDPYCMSFQNTYTVTTLSGFDPGNIAFLPLTVDLGGGLKATILESDIVSYPGMFIKTGGGNTLSGEFAPYPAEFQITATRCQPRVTKRESYIAKTTGPQQFPWRVLAITTDDVQMPVNPLVYALARPNAIGDFSWVKPGKIAWDWWNDWGITGVDFKAGINTATYKHYIDFATENGIEYVVLDEGWSNPRAGDIMGVIDDIDLPEIVRYAGEKKVGILLWAVAQVLDNKLEEACRYYSSLGVRGFKIDFIDRDDQTAIEQIERILKKCAEYRLAIDLHGAAKPAGLNRTYPNLLNVEGVFGLEELKWSNPDMPLYDVTMPFIRMMPGPADYTPGAMTNANKKDFRDVYYRPMSQGTRCHQLAAYIVFDSPLTTLCDSPTAYRREQECTDFIVSVPTVHDETRVLQGSLGEYIVTARRNGGEWFVGGLASWDGRKVSLPLDFLGNGRYTAEIFRDGPNAAKRGEDYTRETLGVDKATLLEIEMAPGGGFAIRISK